MSGNGGRPVSAADIPVEIIREILLFVYPLHAERFRGKATLSWDEDLARPDITPNSLSSVCQLWDAVLADIPCFWEHIVVHLDRPNHLEFFRQALERSRGADIESMTIVRSSEAVDVDEEEEQVALKEIFNILTAPNNRLRIRSLVVRTRWSGSLPSHMISPWEKLRTLKLESEFRASGAQSPLSFTLTDTAPRSFPMSLGILSLTGPMFVKLWRDATGRMAMKEKALLSFTVSHLRPEDGGPRPITFEEFACATFAFANVSITNIVDVDVVSTFGHGLDAINSTYGQRLIFERTPLALVIVLLGRVWGQHQGPDLVSCKIHNCRGLVSTSDRRAVHAAGLGRVRALYLEIKEIADPGGLSLLLRRVTAEEVHIIRCPGLDNRTLCGILNQRRLSLDKMHILHIAECDNCSQDQIQALVERTTGVRVETRDDTSVITWA